MSASRRAGAPGARQIYTQEGKLISLDAWRERYAPPPDQIAKPHDGASVIFTLLAGAAFVALAAVVGLVYAAFGQLGMVIGGGL